jgi:uncharacterized membrane-anchored protein
MSAVVAVVAAVAGILAVLVILPWVFRQMTDSLTTMVRETTSRTLEIVARDLLSTAFHAALSPGEVQQKEAPKEQLEMYSPPWEMWEVPENLPSGPSDATSPGQ